MMSSNILFTSEKLTSERLSWLAELIKFYSIKMYPESLHHRSRFRTPPFTFYLLGDACYAFIDRQHRYLWEDMFKLPAFGCVFDSRELALRGIHMDPFRMRFPGQIISTPDETSETSVWDMLLDATKDHSKSPAVGFLLLRPPYSHNSCSYVLDLFRTAVKCGITPEVYGYLDGVHAMHSNQAPIDHENIGESLTEISTLTLKKGLFPRHLIHSRSATSRGYGTFVGDNGNILSNCIIPPGKITDLDQIVFRFCKNHYIFSHTSFSIKIHPKQIIQNASSVRDPPPLVLLATHSPYGTEYTMGAITLAVACAHRGISTRCVFIEDGVHAISGEHFQERDYPRFDIQAFIQSTSNLDNLEYYYYAPSLSARGLSANPALSYVQKIDPSEFARIVLHPPGHVEASHQRVLVF